MISTRSKLVVDFIFGFFVDDFVDDFLGINSLRLYPVAGKHSHSLHLLPPVICTAPVESEVYWYAGR